MSQTQLDREVAHLTGESVRFIRSMGFSPMNIPYPQQPREIRAGIGSSSAESTERR